MEDTRLRLTEEVLAVEGSVVDEQGPRVLAVDGDEGSSYLLGGMRRYQWVAQARERHRYGCHSPTPLLSPSLKILASQHQMCCGSEWFQSDGMREIWTSLSRRKRPFDLQHGVNPPTSKSTDDHRTKVTVRSLCSIQKSTHSQRFNQEKLISRTWHSYSVPSRKAQ